MSQMSQKDIYIGVLKVTDAILNSLSRNSEDADLKVAIETAKDSFSKLKVGADLTLRELHSNAEWDKLTIAFYGETNAGKSTIIETLRIIKRERTKELQRSGYVEVCQKFDINEETVEALGRKRQYISDCKIELNSLELGVFDLLELRKAEEAAIREKIEILTSKVKKLPFWRRWFSSIWEIADELELKLHAERLSDFKAETKKIALEKNGEITNLQERINIAENDISALHLAMQHLERYQDGAIIGDGQSDFTREAASYEFFENDSKFVLIDVPGIEGNEEIVLDPIMQAVQKAHIVFYVTRKAVPPQKGDENGGEKGTLEKIKEHLGSQTEVWTIFNKSVKSVEQLRPAKLINSGEQDSLSVMEEEMRKQLGGHFAGSVCISAYPAFLASTENFVPGNIKSKDRKKFLAAISSSDILEKTGFSNFANKISSEMVKNARGKIVRSNFNKARNVVDDLKNEVLLLNNETFIPLCENLENQARSSSVQLDSSIESLLNGVDSVVARVVKKGRDGVRDRVYNHIDLDVSNDDFKSYLQRSVEGSVKEIEKKIPEMLEEKLKDFQEELKSIADRFHEHVHGFLNDATAMGRVDLGLHIKIDNGINVAGLIGTALGAIALAFASGGWSLVVGALGIIVSFAKALRSFFSTDYKKSQQRKAADENIDRIFSAVELEYVAQLKVKMGELESGVNVVKEKFLLPAQQAEHIVISLKDSVARLNALSQLIIKEGGL